MKRVLGQLSRDYHKEGISLIKLLPRIREVFYHIRSDPTDDIKECLNMLINIVKSDPSFTEDIYVWALKNNYLTEPIFTAVIRSFSTYDIEKAIQLLEQMPMDPHVRTFSPIFESEHKLSLDQFNRVIDNIKHYQITPSVELFSLLITKAPKGSDILDLIEWSGQHCNILDTIVTMSPSFTSYVVSHIDNGFCSACNISMKTLSITADQRRLMLESVFDGTTIPNITKWVQTRYYNIVIDGANVAHYNNSHFDVRKIIALIGKINVTYQNPKILLVFSICRKKSTNLIIRKWKNVDVFYTKSGIDDDLSWLYATIYYPNILCITNDTIRDHIYYKFVRAVGRNVIDLWMERNVVSYTFDITKVNGHIDVNVSLNIPLPYSIRPQFHVNRDPVNRDPVNRDPVNRDPVKRDPVNRDPVNRDPVNSVHIPIKDGWCCATL